MYSTLKFQTVIHHLRLLLQFSVSSTSVQPPRFWDWEPCQFLLERCNPCTPQICRKTSSGSMWAQRKGGHVLMHTEWSNYLKSRYARKHWSQETIPSCCPIIWNDRTFAFHPTWHLLLDWCYVSQVPKAALYFSPLFQKHRPLLLLLRSRTSEALKGPLKHPWDQIRTNARKWTSEQTSISRFSNSRLGND